MNKGDKTRTVISRGKSKGYKSEMVVYKTAIGKHKGKMLFSSQTRHERVSSVKP